MSESSTEVVVQQPSQVAITEGPGALLSAIVQLAKDPAVDVTKLQALLTMQERMEARQSEAEFNRALMTMPPLRVKKNGVIELPKKDGTIGRVAFAKWEDMADIIEPLLEERGFRLMFNSEPRTADGGGLIVTGTLLHRDGHSRSASMPLALDTGPGRNNLQAIGSTLSYGRRYTAEMLLNVVREGPGGDDDGQSGGQKFITDDQCAEMRDLLKQAGRQEGPFLDRQFGGAVRSIEEINVGQGHLAAVNTLLGIIQMQKAKATA